MKDVECKRTNNAIAKHVIETGHSINWQNTKWIEKQKGTFPRKLLEGCYIRSNRGHLYESERWRIHKRTVWG